MFHDKVTLAHMNMNATRLQVNDTCRPISQKARYTGVVGNGRTLCRSGLKLVGHCALPYGYARVQLSATGSRRGRVI